MSQKNNLINHLNLESPESRPDFCSTFDLNGLNSTACCTGDIIAGQIRLRQQLFKILLKIGKNETNSDSLRFWFGFCSSN